jgi:galactokinase
VNASSAAERFRSVFGTEPELAWHAPGRVNLIGEHTDYNDGFVLPVALPLGVLTVAGRAPHGVLRLASVQHPGEPVELRIDELCPGRLDGWAAYPAGVLWQLARSGARPGAGAQPPGGAWSPGGAALLLDGDLPSGAGLSSSAAVECSVGMAANELYGLGLDRMRVAEMAQAAETEFVGVPCGLMDQCASLLCEDGHALFFDTRALRVEQVPLDFEAAGLALLLVDTASPHRLVAGEYAARRRECEAAAAELGMATLRDVEPDDLARALDRLSSELLRARVRHVVTENARVLEVVSLLRAGRTEQIGELFTASHESLRVDFEVSSTEQDTAVRSALEAGALGARMTGGGFGGSVIAVVTTRTREAVSAAVAEGFARAGLPSPSCSVVHASAGARRVAI